MVSALDDIRTVMWKERKGLLNHRGSRGRALLGMAVPVIMLGICLPLRIGPALVEGPWSLLISVFIPMMTVGMIIPQSFAGERERHTLATLLACRLPDRAILIGKVAVAVSYGWGMTLLLLLVSMVMVNITRWEGRMLLYTPTMALANGMFSLLLAGLVAWLGVLTSLRAATVQQAQQRLMSATLLPVVLLQMIPLLLLNVVPDGREYLHRMVTAADPQQVLLVVLAVLVLLDLVLMAAAMARFKRSRLVVP
jgi:ABC-2 type transport system permease protein